MDGRNEDCLRLRAQAAGYIERFLKKRGINVETEFSERAAKIYDRPEDGKNLSENAQASLRTMRWIMAILIQASLVRGLIS
jgi:hypothetical protein